jgi:hypothetical protein
MGCSRGTSPIPIAATLVVTVIGAVVLYRMDFVQEHAVRNELGCDLSQGFLLAHPMSLEKLRALFLGQSLMSQLA